MVDVISHSPVMVEEVLQHLIWRAGGCYVDATVGAGGHAEAILRRDPRARVMGIDADPAALELAQKRLQVFGQRFQVFHSNFKNVASLFKDQSLSWIDGIVADLGVSSMQLDSPERGFSFLHEGPLDMRMDTGGTQRAEDILNTFSERDLADLIYRFGEERFSRRIAREIVRRRPLRSTTQLAAIIARCYPHRGRQRLHPATRTFQALRIFVNDEMGALERFLGDIPPLLTPRGRAVLISFHSLEDRLVKQAFREWQQRKLARVLTAHVVVASELERQRNPRSRSAKLRAAEKLETGLETNFK